MPFCTIVEFEWNGALDRERFASFIESLGGDGASPEGRLMKIVGIDDHGARIIEVWRSGDDAKAVAEKSAAAPAGVMMPRPTRVVGFETTAYVVD